METQNLEAMLKSESFVADENNPNNVHKKEESNVKFNQYEEEFVDF